MFLSSANLMKFVRFKNNVIFVETSIPKYMIVQASAALSADGYTDDTSPGRLVLSHPADWQEVYRLRGRL